jgi:hypothetical protein
MLLLFYSDRTNVGLYWEINHSYFRTQLSQFSLHIHPPVKLSVQFRMYYLINKHNTYFCTLGILCYTSTHLASVADFGTDHPVLMLINEKKMCSKEEGYICWLCKHDNLKQFSILYRPARHVLLHHIFIDSGHAWVIVDGKYVYSLTRMKVVQLWKLLKLL